MTLPSYNWEQLTSLPRKNQMQTIISPITIKNILAQYKQSDTDISQKIKLLTDLLLDRPVITDEDAPDLSTMEDNLNSEDQHIPKDEIFPGLSTIVKSLNSKDSHIAEDAILYTLNDLLEEENPPAENFIDAQMLVHGFKQRLFGRSYITANDDDITESNFAVFFKSLQLSKAKKLYYAYTKLNDPRYLSNLASTNIRELNLSYIELHNLQYSWRVFFESLNTADIESLNINGIGLDKLTAMAWQEFCAGLASSNVKNLTMIEDLSKLTTKRLEELFIALSTLSLESIVLPLIWYPVDEAQWEMICNGFKMLNTKSLNIKSAIFKPALNLSPEQIIRFFTALKTNEQIKQIRLEIKLDKHLAEQHRDAINIGLKQLPLSHFDFSWSNIETLSNEQLLAFFDAIPTEKLQSLDCHANHFYDMTSEQLAIFCKLLKRLNLSYLDLSTNFLNSLEQYTALFDALKPEIKDNVLIPKNPLTLDFTMNLLFNLDSETLAIICNLLKQTNITVLKLDACQNEDSFQEKYVGFFDKLQGSVIKHLELEGVRLGEFKEENLTALFANFKKIGITHLDLRASLYYLFAKENGLELFLGCLETSGIISMSLTGDNITLAQQTKINEVLLKNSQIAALNFPNGSLKSGILHSLWSQKNPALNASVLNNSHKLTPDLIEEIETPLIKLTIN